MLAIWTLVSLPFLKPAWTSGSSRFTYCWSLAWRILSITLLVCEMSAIVRWFQHSLALPFFGIGMKTDLFQSYGWAPKNWCLWTVLLKKSLESPLDCKEIQSVHPKGDQSKVSTGRTDVEAETPILWPPDAKSWLIGKDPAAGKDWGQEKKGMTEDEMFGWHHQLYWHEFG